MLVKGGSPLADTAASPPELGVGQYNASNLKLQPSYGLWARHVMGLTITKCSFNYEKPDSRYVFFLDDVVEAKIEGVKMMKGKENPELIKLKKSSNVSVINSVYYKEWNKEPVNIYSATDKAAIK